ncbi:SH3 domain-containing C40 family peptidase [Fodinibius sp. Rm-B-1B1-1]|uniref:C40 family peptidase n=1 Tax=Fodinibius alkaliphilus TaxID=3140241 RepID=UPI003159B9B5
MKVRVLSLSLIVLFFVSLVACGPSQKQDIQQKITNTSQHFAPDSRVALFDVKAISNNGEWLLKGETNLPEAKEALLDSLSAMDVSNVDSIKVLPAEELEGKTFGIVNNSVANLRSRPSHPAQLVTQATLGMPVKVLKKEGSWYMIQTPDDYLSWVDYGGVEPMDSKKYADWKEADKIIFLETNGYAYEKPSSESTKVSDLVSGSILKTTGTSGNYYEVSYPDGRTGFVSQSEARSFDDWKASVEASENELVEQAKSLKGSPYLWGGTSSKGMDCSGFTKTIYFMNGWIIPRDASQQIHAGELVDTSDGFDNLRPGDLLFFGQEATEDRDRRVVHVGMWIGNDQFIHSAGRVKISSVDPESEYYDEYNLNRYLETRRYLQHKEGNILDVEDMYEI